MRDGKDESGHPVEMTTESNYFFKLSRYTEPLLAHSRATALPTIPAPTMRMSKGFISERNPLRKRVVFGKQQPGLASHPSPPADAGIHLLVEKPLGTSLAGVDELLVSAQKRLT